jgi:hypothetical protein
MARKVHQCGRPIPSGEGGAQWHVTAPSVGAARALGFDIRARLARRLYERISASASALRTRGMTLKGWLALGDGYCNVGRRRSWTGFKLINPPERARPTGPNRVPVPDHGPVTTRRRPVTTATRATLPVQRGTLGIDAPRVSRSGIITLRRTRVSRRRISPRSPLRLRRMGLGCAAACTAHLPLGRSPQRLHHLPGRRRPGRLAPARPTQTPDWPGSHGPRPGTGAEPGPAH